MSSARLNNYIAEYSKSHQHPLNQVIHMFCVPIITMSTLGLLWLVPLGTWLGVDPAWAEYVNGATLLAVLAMIFYFTLSVGTVLTMAVWLAVSVACIYGIQALGLPLLWTCVVLWVGAWAAQFYGHEVEGEKPSFFADIFYLLIGPLYVTRKFMQKF